MNTRYLIQLLFLTLMWIGQFLYAEGPAVPQGNAAQAVPVGGESFTSVIYAQDFDATNLPPHWHGNYQGKGVSVKLVPGALGSVGALSSTEPLPQYGTLYVTMTPPFVFTEQTYICALVKSDLEADIYVNVCTPYNSPAPVVKLAKDKWTPLCMPFAQYKLAPTNRIVEVHYVNNLAAKTTLTIDNFAIIRAPKNSRPNAVQGIQGKSDKDGVTLTWKPASDEAGVAGYGVYRSNVREFTCDAGSEIVNITDLAYVDTQIMMPGTWWYRIAAKDYLGNPGPASEAVSVVVTEE